MTDDCQTADPRIGSITRETKETAISAKIILDGTGLASINTSIGFFDHMLEQLARHSLMDISLTAKGDLHIDSHHTVEDCGWALGAALNAALGSRGGICRYGWCTLPMDEVLTRAAVDISGRPFLVWRVNLPAPSLGTIDTEVFREFFQALSQSSGITLHIDTLYGSNTHHIIESCFKAVARALRAAVMLDPREEGRIPSTKEILARGGQ